MFNINVVMFRLLALGIKKTQNNAWYLCFTDLRLIIHNNKYVKHKYQVLFRILLLINVL